MAFETRVLNIPAALLEAWILSLRLEVDGVKVDGAWVIRSANARTNEIASGRK
jgi:hypothetical protein